MARHMTNYLVAVESPLFLADASEQGAQCGGTECWCKQLEFDCIGFSDIKNHSEFSSKGSSTQICYRILVIASTMAQRTER